MSVHLLRPQEQSAPPLSVHFCCLPQSAEVPVFPLGPQHAHRGGSKAEGHCLSAPCLLGSLCSSSWELLGESELEPSLDIFSPNNPSLKITATQFCVNSHRILEVPAPKMHPENCHWLPAWLLFSLQPLMLQSGTVGHAFAMSSHSSHLVWRHSRSLSQWGNRWQRRDGTHSKSH